MTLLLADRLGVRAAAVGLAVGSLALVAVQTPALLRRVSLRGLRWRVDRVFVRSLAPAIPIVMFSLLRHGQTLGMADAPVLRTSATPLLTLTTCWPIGYFGSAPDRCNAGSAAVPPLEYQGGYEH